mmetsp:Transcript_14179/g.41511  ORF Transcript_14179/g.41511 Transcript_14179/m.41511 type:complete len:279 (-) Transcript_14179:49-885(-)
MPPPWRRPGFEESRASQENVGWPSSRSESNPQRVCSTATISAKLGTDGTALAGCTKSSRSSRSRSFRCCAAAVLSVQMRKSYSPSALPLFACSRTHPRSAPPPPPRRIATARVSYLASTPSSKPLQMAFIPGVPTYRKAAAAYEQREVQAKGVRAGTARSCLWVGRDASLRRPDAMLSGPRVAPALLDPLADRDREGVRLWRKVLGAMVPLISVRTARRHPAARPTTALENRDVVCRSQPPGACGGSNAGALDGDTHGPSLGDDDHGCSQPEAKRAAA